MDQEGKLSDITGSYILQWKTLFSLALSYNKLTILALNDDVLGSQ